MENNKTRDIKCACHYKSTPRSKVELKQLKNRLNRVIGQLNGISNMLDDNRYCGDILIQMAAAQSALQAFSYMLLKGHLETCVTEQILQGKTEIVDEVLDLIKRLK